MAIGIESLRDPGVKNFPLLTKLSMARSTSEHCYYMVERDPPVHAVTHLQIAMRMHSYHRAEK